MLAFADAQSLDISGPLEVFALASWQYREDHPGDAALYDVRIVARQAEPVTLASGLRLLPDLTCNELPDNVDTLLVSGGMGDALDRLRADTELVTWLRDTATRVRRIGSVCNGALLLAEAGVLDGREATTHWRDVAQLQQRYPRVQVMPDAIYTRDDRVWTSAGITSGMDLALAMVAADHGLPLALKVAKRMVMVSKRSGGQSQFSRQLQDGRILLLIGVDAPSSGATRSEVVATYSDDATNSRQALGVLLTGLGGICFLPFVGHVRRVLRDRAGADSILPATAFAGGIVLVGGLFTGAVLSSAVSAGSYFDAHRVDADLAMTTVAAGFYLNGFAAMAGGALIAALAVVARQWEPAAPVADRARLRSGRRVDPG